MRSANILFKDEVAGIITQLDNGSFTFEYDATWVVDINKPSISLTLPKRNQAYKSDYLFPFFYNMLPEGSNRAAVCRLNKIDLNDHFALLMIATKYDSIGAVNVVRLTQSTE